MGFRETLRELTAQVAVLTERVEALETKATPKRKLTATKD